MVCVGEVLSMCIREEYEIEPAMPVKRKIYGDFVGYG